MTRVTLIIIATATALILLSLGLIALARGYQVNLTTRTLSPSGILVATSDPDGAEVRIDGVLRTATNNTINLPPGNYVVRIEKDGFSPWEKTFTLEKEEVYKTNAFLFPAVPDLRPMTFSGALSPTLSPDGTKIAYAVASASAEKNGLFVADLSRSSLPGPLANSADIRQIFRDSPGFTLSNSELSWSPDSKQILASASSNLSYLLEIDRLNDPTPVTVRLAEIFTSWDNLRKTEDLTNRSRLSPTLLQFLSSAAAQLKFSPDQSKILYQATVSAELLQIIKTTIPGKNPTLEVRQIQAGNTYVYDTKEDKNYLIENIAKRDISCAEGATNCKFQNISWFPSSRHLLIHTDKEIALAEYDGTNKAIVYGGPFTNQIVFPWPNWGKIVVLTSLNYPAFEGMNLYTINLR